MRYLKVKKELFKGLWIYKADYAREKHSVVRIDFSKEKAENKVDKDIYIFEFKFNGDENNALNQIKERKYFEKYQGTEVRHQRRDKGVTKKFISSVFGFTDRNVGEWVVEKMSARS